MRIYIVRKYGIRMETETPVGNEGGGDGVTPVGVEGGDGVTPVDVETGVVVAEPPANPVRKPDDRVPFAAAAGALVCMLVCCVPVLAVWLFGALLFVPCLILVFVVCGLFWKLGESHHDSDADAILTIFFFVFAISCILLCSAPFILLGVMLWPTCGWLFLPAAVVVGVAVGIAAYVQNWHKN